jgi:hypothetical protein
MRLILRNTLVILVLLGGAFAAAACPVGTHDCGYGTCCKN